MQTRVSLSPEAEAGSEARHWATFSDVALAMLLVFILFILAQFLQYEKIFVLEEIARRQAEVEAAILSADAPNDSVAISFWKDDDFITQRVRITGAEFFQGCSELLSDRGTATLRLIGSVLQTRAMWFEAIQVEGHADRRPPSDSCLNRGIEDNWQLSARRATEVVRAFSAWGVLPDSVLSSVGRGEFYPLSAAEDTTAEAYQRDRRIELVIRYSDDGIIEEREGE